MRGTIKVVAGIAVATFGVLTATMVGAAPALAMNPCLSDNPPPTCDSQPLPPPPAPAAPANLAAVSVLQSSVTLQWTDVAINETSYRIVRTVNGVGTALTASANTTSFTDSAAPAGYYIDYYVSAVRCGLDDNCSTSAAVHVAVSTHPISVSPTWGGFTDNLWGSTYYWSGWTIDWDTTAPLQVAVTSDGAIQHSYTASNPVANLNASHPGYGDNHGFSVTATKSTVKGSHTLCLVAYNVGGGSDVNLICQPYTVAGPPSAASNLRLTNTGTSIVITFTDNANDETGYWLQRSTDNGASWLSVGSQYAPVAGSGGTGTATDFSSPAAGTQYRILMINASGNTPSAAITV